MKLKTSVFIATSIDGYIADKNGGIDWLNSVPNPDQLDMGYEDFMNRTDAIVMGRNTFETVCGFDIDWPYNKPVYVLSNTLTNIPKPYQDKAYLISGSLSEILEKLKAKGHQVIYIDGGKTIQSFLKEDLIDEITISIIPILLGGGIPLFSDLDKELLFECTSTTIYLDKIVQNRFIRRS